MAQSGFEIDQVSMTTSNGFLCGVPLEFDSKSFRWKAFVTLCRIAQPDRCCVTTTESAVRHLRPNWTPKARMKSQARPIVISQNLGDTQSL